MKTKVDVKTTWGILPKGTEVEILDDNTPLHQSYRVHPIGTGDIQIFGVDKTGAHGILELE